MNSALQNLSLQNPHEIIRKIAIFLGKPLRKEDIAKIAELCRFEHMKENPSVNYSWWDDLGLRNKREAHFMRKGLCSNP